MAEKKDGMKSGNRSGEQEALVHGVPDREQEPTVSLPVFRAKFMRDVRAGGHGVEGHLWMENIGRHFDEHFLDIWVVAENGRTFRLTDILVMGDEWHSLATLEDYTARFRRFVNSFRMIYRTAWHWPDIRGFLARCGEGDDPLDIIREPVRAESEEERPPTKWEDTVLVSKYKSSCLDCGRENPLYDRYGPLFECDACGTLYNNKNGFHRSLKSCPKCRKHGREVAERSCVFCCGETKYVEFYDCPLCSAQVPVELWRKHYKLHTRKRG